MASTIERLAHAWNVFVNDAKTEAVWDTGPVSTSRPDRVHLVVANEKSLVTSIYTRISVDASAWTLLHVRVNEDGVFEDVIPSGLNNCLTVEANLDQAATTFLQDAVMVLLDKGAVALVPQDTTLDPNITGSFDITTMRAAEIVKWHPKHVTVLLYNEEIGKKKEIKLPKSYVAIVQNPLYAVMNAPNSTLQRLNRKLQLLDVVDEQASSGKLDILVKLPYTIRSDSRRKEAERRRNDIQTQLKDSKYGIAYIDGTENVTQLNRPAENNLLSTIEYLMKLLYGQLGITEEVVLGTADEATMLNYYARTIKPILRAFVEEMKRKFLTKTARTQNQSIMFFRDPFEFLTVTNLADAADKLSRNTIVVPNEIRPHLGLRPSKDPAANKLGNRNMPTDQQAPPGQSPPAAEEAPPKPEEGKTSK